MFGEIKNRKEGDGEGKSTNMLWGGGVGTLSLKHRDKILR